MSIHKDNDIGSENDEDISMKETGNLIENQIL
jgi:hypothetical protein